MPKLAIIGASELQLPLIRRAQDMGCTTHVFAWATPGAPDVGEAAADVFHPISITECDAIVAVCEREQVDGVCTIASDLASVAVGKVAQALGLAGNPPQVVARCTDKHLMRRAFEAAGCPSPASVAVPADAEALAFARELLAARAAGQGALPAAAALIVKPADRSGSRGITKLAPGVDAPALAGALQAARAASFSGEALVEEFACGREFSVEGISWQGSHRILAVTEKFTTGAPHFIERGHLQPARVSPEEDALLRQVALQALDALGVACGASHTEVKLAPDGTVRLVEVGARMGGDFIGSHLVRLSTGYDFLGAVVDVALGRAPAEPAAGNGRAAAVRYVFGPGDAAALQQVRTQAPELLVQASALAPFDHAVTDSASRFGSFVLAADDVAALAPYLPPCVEGTAA